MGLIRVVWGLNHWLSRHFDRVVYLGNIYYVRVDSSVRINTISSKNQQSWSSMLLTVTFVTSICVFGLPELVYFCLCCCQLVHVDLSMCHNMCC